MKSGISSRSIASICDFIKKSLGQGERVGYPKPPPFVCLSQPRPLSNQARELIQSCRKIAGFSLIHKDFVKRRSFCCPAALAGSSSFLAGCAVRD
jgi:hypothetical protein